MEEPGGRARFPLRGWREDPRAELRVTQRGLLPGEERGAPRAGGLRGRPTTPPPRYPLRVFAAAARQSGARGADVSRRLRGEGGSRGGEGGWRPFRFAHPSWNGRLWPGRPGGFAPPCEITAAGTAAPVSCVQTRNCVYDPPPPRPPRGEGRGSGPVSALGEPRPTPPTPGPDSFPALQDRSRSPRAPRSPPRALLPVKLNAIPRGETLKGTFRAKSHFFPPLPLCRSAGGREGQCN